MTNKPLPPVSPSVSSSYRLPLPSPFPHESQFPLPFTTNHSSTSLPPRITVPHPFPHESQFPLPSPTNHSPPPPSPTNHSSPSLPPRIKIPPPHHKGPHAVGISVRLSYMNHFDGSLVQYKQAGQTVPTQEAISVKHSCHRSVFARGALDLTTTTQPVTQHALHSAGVPARLVTLCTSEVAFTSKESEGGNHLLLSTLLSATSDVFGNRYVRKQLGL